MQKRESVERSCVPSPSQYLKSLIADNGGAISVERFMQEALYHPEFGYYANRVRRIGKGGDFSTTATLHPALARAIANWAAAHRQEVRRSGEWHLIELGGGGGQLAEGVLTAAGWFARRGLRYHIVDVSVPLRALQEARLRRFGARVAWHADIAGALAAAKGAALIFSNEFVDAFPCAQFIRTGSPDTPWNEVMLTWPADSPVPFETVAPLSLADADRNASSVLSDEHALQSAPGQRVETLFAYRRWLKSWESAWHKGRMLTIDYGDELPALYRGRALGSLRAYAHHQRLTGPGIYRHFGQQDLTSDVNFTDLKRWGEDLGLVTQDFRTQASFLHQYLKPGIVRAWEKSDESFRFIIDEAGAGSAFKVLEQRKFAKEGT